MSAETLDNSREGAKTRSISQPYRIHKRPAGDYVIDRWTEAGTIRRWGIYQRHGDAELALRIANASLNGGEFHGERAR